MDITAFWGQSRVVIVAGKGGVGKTTVTATMARAAAGAGLRVLVIELEGKAGIASAFGMNEPAGYEESVLLQTSPEGSGEVRIRRVTPDDALLEYLSDHGLERVSRRLVSSGMVDVVATAIPGIRDVLVLGKVKQLEKDKVADLILVDAPATGHAVTFLTSASGLLDATRGGPVRVQAADVVELLQDADRCRVILVTLPEEMPVNETIEAAYQLEDKAGVQLGPIVVNCWDDMPAALAGEPEKSGSHDNAPSVAGDRSTETSFAAALASAKQFRVHRHHLAVEQVERLGRELPLTQLRIPMLSAPTIGPPEILELAEAFGCAIEEMHMPGTAE